MQKLTGQPWPARGPRRHCRRPGRFPSHVAAIPITAARAIATPVRFTTRNAAAAGPMSRAVDRIATMVTADKETATARASRWRTPTRRAGTPAGRGQVVADRGEQQGSVEGDHCHQGGHTEYGDDRDRRRRW